MATQTITINIPEPLYRRLQQRAEQVHRSIEEVVLELLVSALLDDSALPADPDSVLLPKE